MPVKIASKSIAPVVRNLPPPQASMPPPAVGPLPIPGAAPTSTNRSGLADGTNPGQGAGRANSPNQGTLNPNAATARAKKSAKKI